MLLPSRKMRPLGPVLCLLGLLVDTHPVAAQSRLVREYVYAGDRLLATTGQAANATAAGWYRPSTSQFFLHGRLESVPGQPSIPPFVYGQPGDKPLAGDWNGDGVDTIGVYRPAASAFYLRNLNSAGSADVAFVFGAVGDLPLAGDWNGDGVDTIGVYRPSNSTFYLRNSNSPGNPDIVVPFGASGDLPVVGDWEGDGIDTIGVYRQDTFYLRYSNSPGGADRVFPFAKAEPGWPVSGDWNLDGADGVGIFVDRGQAGSQIYRILDLYDKNLFPPIAWAGSKPGDLPVMGDFDGLP